MQHLHTIQNLSEDLIALLPRQPVLEIQEVAFESALFTVLQHQQIVLPVIDFHYKRVISPDDVPMLELGQQLGFVFHHLYVVHLHIEHLDCALLGKSCVCDLPRNV